MAEVIPINGQGSWRKDYRYAVYEHKLVTTDGMTYPRSFIVIKNSYGVIIRFTRLHNFTGAYENRVYRPLASDAKGKLYYICRMLNYVLVDHYSIYRIDHVFKVTKDMLVSFFMDYALERKPDGTHKGSQSIEKCVSAVTLFFSKLIYKYGSYVTLRRNELYKEKDVYTGKGKWMKKKIPDFQIRGIPEEKNIFRDIPTKVFQILMNLAVRYTPDIALAIGLQAFGGLRPGEVCNVRQEASPKGAGILFTFITSRNLNE